MYIHYPVVTKAGLPGEKVHALGSQIVREIVLPQLEKEVNEGQNFSPLRQVFSGMILAAWYKRALRESLLGKIYANKDRVKGIDQDPKNNEAIYQQYLKAYKKGVFNFIKEDVDKYTNETIPRKYFSGGFAPNFGKALHLHQKVIHRRPWQQQSSRIEIMPKQHMTVQASVDPPTRRWLMLIAIMGLNYLLMRK